MVYPSVCAEFQVPIVLSLVCMRRHKITQFTKIIYIDHFLSKGPYGWQVGPFDKNFFLLFFNCQGHTHILTKIREKNRVLSGICPFDK